MKRSVQLGLMTAAAAIPLAWGQAAIAAANTVGIDPTTGQMPTPVQLFYTSPYINGAILVLSVIALLLFIFFYLTIHPGALAPSSFVDDVNRLVMASKYEEAATVCRAHRRVFVASVIQRCVENAGKQHSVIMDMLDSEGRRRADIVWNRISYLADIANVAPMLGLLGTVWGMIQAFFAMRFQSLSAESGALSEAIGGAMATTMFGLIVGIAAMLFHTVIKARATRGLALAEQVVHSIADHIKRDE